ncbi:phosphotransferase [Chitinophaga horti]|uniref:Phosphotransferase n=1 Tax=Chitinophaga horti TaxID=2920382 RepID=A0ABY6J5F2_9BACT|nr:phosphotransferase [Chitinophaga horti]UYQ94576.1 phosphotransferase [Chitinophaga horti]
MQIFPTQYSTLSAKALKHRIADSYRLKVRSCRYLMRGVSDTYVIEAEEGKFIFKIYRDMHRSLDAIQGELELMNILQREGARIAGAVKNRAGREIESFQAAEGMRHGVLTHFAKGKSSQELSDAQLDVLGREMAFNHNVTANLQLHYERPVYDFETTMHRPLQNLSVAYADYPDDYALLKETAAEVEAKLQQFDLDNFSYGYVHFDYFPKNFFFDDQQFTLFDFDFAGRGWLVYDLVSLYSHFTIMLRNKLITEEEARRQLHRVLAAYRGTRGLSEEEQAAIPYLNFTFLLFYLEFHYLNYDDWSNTFWGERHMKSFAKHMRDQLSILPL